MNKLEELPMREYLMYALGASHAQDFDEFNEQFYKIFFDDSSENNQKEDKAEL